MILITDDSDKHASALPLTSVHSINGTLVHLPSVMATAATTIISIISISSTTTTTTTAALK